MTRIALIHAVTVAVDPVLQAFAELWPEANCVNMLDDSLSPDRARDADLTPAMVQRIADLGGYALRAGADGVLFTCSAFGPAIDAFARMTDRPVLKPNEAMFRQALSQARTIGMLATFGPSVRSMEDEFAEMGNGATIRTVLVADAMTALKGGDAETHNRLLAEAAPTLRDCQAIMLAHFSTSRAYAAVASAVTVPVLTAPRSAVMELRRSLERA
jgi:Asp/Glu/hydantoin racemase